MGENGLRAFSGVVNDVFGGDAAAVNEFKDAFAAGSYKPEAFDNHVNFFADRTVGAIVLEVPNALLGTEGAVHAWPTVSLFGHAPEQQVARWGLPLFTHLFLNDDDLREAFNRTPPRGTMRRSSRAPSTRSPTTSPSPAPRPTRRPMHTGSPRCSGRWHCPTPWALRHRSITPASTGARWATT